MRGKLLIILIITVALLAAVLWDLDLAEAKEALLAANLVWALPATMAYLAAHALRGVRLAALLGRPMSQKRLFIINAVGYLAINIVPFRLGEMVRPYMLQRDADIPFGHGLSAVFLERLMDVFALLLMLTTATFVVTLPSEVIEVGGIDVMAVAQRSAMVVCTLGSVGALGFVLVGEPVFRLVEKLPMGMRLAGLGRRFRDGLAGLTVARVALALGTTGLIWFAVVLAISASLASFQGVPADLGTAMFAWALTLATTSAIPTPGFFGSYELGFAAALFVVGVSGHLARVVAVAVHLGMFGFAVVLGLVFVLVDGIDLRDLVNESQATPTS